MHEHEPSIAVLFGGWFVVGSLFWSALFVFTFMFAIAGHGETEVPILIRLGFPLGSQMPIQRWAAIHGLEPLIFVSDFLLFQILFATPFVLAWAILRRIPHSSRGRSG